MAKMEAFSFLSKEGKTKIHALRWIPESGEYDAVLQITHGMVEYIERYQLFAEYLTEHGFMVVAHDHLGHGESVGSRDDWGYMADNPSDTLVEDMHTLRTMSQEEGKPYFMLGHSMGSYLLRKYLSIHGDGIWGAIIMGTGYIPDGTVKLAMRVARFQAGILGWRHRSRLLQKLSYSKPYKKYSLDGRDVNNSWLTKDQLIVEKYYADPKCTFVFTVNAYMGLFEAVLFDNQPENIKKIPKKLPLFLISGADDPVGDLGEGVKHVYDSYKDAGVEDIIWRLFENDRHEILNETDKEEVYKDILSWLKIHI